MNPFGNAGLWILGIVAFIITLSFGFLPHEWAIGITIGIIAIVVIGFFYILANTRFT